MPTNGNGDKVQRVGAESGHWYVVQDNSTMLLTEVPCRSEETRAGKGYVCGACGQPIAKGTQHRAGSDHRHLDCPQATREPTLADARPRQALPGVSSIRNQRRQSSLQTYREFNCALAGVRLGATPPEGSDPAKDAEALAIAACEAFAAEGEKLQADGTACHAAIARYFERGELPEDERWARTCRSLSAFLAEHGVTDPASCWCEVPVANPGAGYGGTMDLLVVAPAAVLLIDHKTKDFTDARRRLAALKAQPPFHLRPWTEEGMQMAAYKTMLQSSIAVVGQAEAHRNLRIALATGTPVRCYEHYIDRGTGETWTLDWQEHRLSWQKPDARLHKGLKWYGKLFDHYRLAWFHENEYYPTGLVGHDADGTPLPGELERMAAMTGGH